MGIRATQAEAAREFNVSRQAINNLVKRGILALDGDGKLDLELVRAAVATMSPAKSKLAARLAGAPTPLQAAPDPGAQAPTGASSAPPSGEGEGALTFHVARALAEKYRALNERAEYEERIGKLVKADDVQKAAYASARAARDALMALPARLAAVLAAESSTARCHEILELEIHRICEDLAQGRS